MQQRMQEMQDRLGLMEVDGQSGGGAVKIRMTCRGEVMAVTIDPSVIVAEEKEVMEDLVMAAVNAARENADSTLAAETRQMMEGLGLPGDTQNCRACKRVDYDVAIIGAGFCGTMVAVNLAAADAGLKIALIERRRSPGRGRRLWHAGPMRICSMSAPAG